MPKLSDHVLSIYTVGHKPILIQHVLSQAWVQLGLEPHISTPAYI